MPELISFSPSFPACSSAPSAVTIVLAVIGSVVLIGTILLGLWKLLVTIHDRREFDRFQSERTRARYEMVSTGGLLGGPLAMQQTTAVMENREVKVCAVLLGTSGGQVYKEAFWGGFLAIGLLSISGHQMGHWVGPIKAKSIVTCRAERGGWKRLSREMCMSHTQRCSGLDEACSKLVYWEVILAMEPDRH